MGCVELVKQLSSENYEELNGELERPWHAQIGQSNLYGILRHQALQVQVEQAFSSRLELTLSSYFPNTDAEINIDCAGIAHDLSSNHTKTCLLRPRRISYRAA